MRKSFFYWSFVFCCAAWFPGDQITLGEDLPKSRVTNAKHKTESVEIRDFEVRVDNKAAGTHRLTIKSEGDTNEVAFQTDVKFDFIVYAYVFKFRGTEVWRDGRLELSDIRCEDGGKKRSMALKTDGDIQQISFNGKSVPANSLCVMSTAYWRLPCEELRNKPLAIVDVDSGATRSASLNVVGPTTITTSGRSLTCHHFKIDGPSPAELWFDEHDRLVRQKSVEQGHHMELRLKDIRISKESQ
jgi:hypothetical protein